MKLIPAKCPDCGADIKITEGSNSLTCEYCGGQIIVTDVLGTTAVMQNCMILAYSAMESNNYEEAYDHFNRAIEIDLKNPNAWFGKAVCTGMTRKINEDVFGKMVSAFESAINNSPADKQANLKKNAAAEIVKIMRKSSLNIKLAFELGEFEVDEQYSSEIKKDLDDLKEKVLKTVQKAHEYDENNNDVKVLLDEITTGKFFAQQPQDALKSADNMDENAPITSINNPAQTIIPDTNNSAAVNTTVNKQKSGCTMVLIVLTFIIAATFYLTGYIFS